ncbi:zinc finger CCCH domain-containing protein 3 [Brachyistius frenatus]|uniref:zinc finger CCCH domain-containing protein 3 n=1 Tax=Brachyistius frenatus TaxID=100188 RepID=UPI0037E71B8D
MEEREALKRQIELLQNLINNHKSVHGDAPFTGSEQRHPATSTSSRGHGSSSVGPPRDSGRGTYAPQSRGSWRKTYSLKNKSPPSSVGHPSASSSSSVHQSTSGSPTPGVSLPNETKTATASSGIIEQKKDGHIGSVKGGAGEKKPTETPGQQDEHEDGRRGSEDARVRHEILRGKAEESRDTAESGHVVVAGKTVSVPSEAPSSVKTSTAAQIKPLLSSRTATETKRTATPAALTAGASKQPPGDTSSQIRQVQAGASFLKKSKFTWVKSQNTGAAEPRVTAGSTSSLAGGKRTPAKKLPRKLSPVTAAPRTSKYRWVSSVGAQTKTPRKPLSPKALIPSQRDASKKLKPGSAPSAKLRKGTAGSSAGPSPSSRYRWKAAGQSPSLAATGGATAARRRSAFHWTAERSSRGAKAGLVVVSPQRASFPSSSPGGFKLRSRMKIIRRSAGSGGGSEKAGGPSTGKFSPRGRTHAFTRSPFAVRRELVSFGRHKLRRLSPTSSRTNPASSCHRSPASQRVFRTRYKMVTRPGSGAATAVHTLHYNPALSWRAKRIQSARSFLQSRLRAPTPQHWRGSSMCWIGDSLYRVSANKLSRTVAASMSINRTGRFSGPNVSHMSPAFARPSSTRHLASRAVQRSLAIIRHARQKKQQKQYCMYYNRFGRCNRGNSCPFIHDPDKVAVCTRFLRGTCKQADGTCPFSHKVAKEKMPVCSYFLKGICSNSDCPYSHVYVSRKAEVCEDFVKGYCPDGEKCKKKHTLVCPDFSKTGSCPRGSRCKLQHRQRAKRSAAAAVAAPAKKSRSKEPPKRPRLSVVMPDDLQAAPRTPAAGPLELPSFISLSSSPEEADAPETLPADASQVKEKKLQIKPRL